MNIIEPNLNGEHLRIGIVQARFTNEVGSAIDCSTSGTSNAPGTVGPAMLKAAVEKLHELGVKDDNITVTTVPGALEVPLVLQSMAGTQRFDALIAIGCVIRGETYHFELVSNESAAGITRMTLDYSIPPEIMPLTKPQTALPLWPNSGNAIIATPPTAMIRLKICSLFSLSSNRKKPMAARKKICKLLSRVEMPGPTL